MGIAKIKDKLYRLMGKEYIHMDPDGYSTILINPLFSASLHQTGPISEKMSYVGRNTGNLIFSEGIKEQLYIEKEIWLMPDEIPQSKSACIMPSANFLIAGGDTFINQCQHFLDHTDCPVTLAGLGAQSTKELNTPAKLISALTESKKYFCKTLSERSVTIGVRGEFTAECLEKMGIKNYRIIGCPSAYHFLNGCPPKLPSPSLTKCQITVTTGNKYESKLIRAGKELDAIWMMQMMTEMPECAFEDKWVSPVWVEKRFPDLGISVNAYKQYMKKNAKIFFDFKEWNEFYQNSGDPFTFAFGSRFHGNMAAFRNGIPALWITHDSRTSELTQTLHLPSITQKEWWEFDRFEDLLSHCNYDNFYQNYPFLLQNYVQFLEENHISHKFII